MASHPEQHSRGLWVAALFVVLAGLFGMHGLAGHGSEDMTGMPGMTSAGSATGSPSAARVYVPGSAAGVAGDVILAATAHHPAAHDTTRALTDTGAMTGMGVCVAVLVGGLLLLALLASRGRYRGFVRVPLRRLPDLGVGRYRSPLSLIQLSICRC